jgi:hypothetical protein
MSYWRAAGVLWLTVLAMAGQTFAQATPNISDQTKAAKTDLTDAQKAEVDAFVKFCADRMAVNMAGPLPKTAQDAIKAGRDTMLAAYGKTNGLGYMQYFAASAATNFVPVVLKCPADLARVNGCMVVAAIQQTEILPALDVMAKNDSAAVRYYAVKGYLTLRQALLGQGTRGRDQFMAAMTAIVQKETSPVVLGLVCQAIDLTTGLTGVPENVLQPARASARQVLLALVTKDLQAVRDGDLPMCAAISRAVKAAGALGAETRDQERAAMLGMLGNVMENAM